MKKKLILFIILIFNLNGNAQISNLNALFEAVRFNKFIDKVNNGGKEIKYESIDGTPYYNKMFIAAKINGSTESVPVRYNSFTDKVEVLKGNDIYELPINEKLSKFTFDTGEFLIYQNTYDDNSGYFFLLVNGQNQLLKKSITRFKPEIPALNSFTSTIPPKFEKADPIYYIKNDTQIIKITKGLKELLNSFSDKKNSIDDFMKKEKIKYNKEDDLIKLVKFINN